MSIGAHCDYMKQEIPNDDDNEIEQVPSAANVGAGMHD